MDRFELQAHFTRADVDRISYRAQLSAHFGHLEPDNLIEAMGIVRDAHKPGFSRTVKELHDQLAERMLMVGGSNDVANEQLTVLMHNYWIDQPTWDTIIAGQENQQGELQ